ncbi:MAG: hypothetical protein HYV95_02610 [Opitutae bacterium]|nr:hypothetical protein [Opitutae bacterium]
MDDTLTELENELKALHPRAPSAGLQARIERELAAPAPATAAAAPRYTAATTFRSWKWAGWRLATAAAVALLVSLGVWRSQSSAPGDTPLDQAVSPTVVARQSPAIIRPEPSVAPASAQRYRPVGATNVLYDMKDEGPAYLADNTPARRMRYRYVDTYTWKTPASNASLKWSVPREEVRVIPASLH